MIRTLAPSAMHWSACVFCFCGSPCALTTRAATPAALNAFCSAGRSNCSQRTDVLVSGISPQMVTPALLLLCPALAEATTTVATTPTTPSSRTGELRKTLFTCTPSPSVVFVRQSAPPPVSRRRPRKSRGDCRFTTVKTLRFGACRQVQARSAFARASVGDPGDHVVGGGPDARALGLLPRVEQALRIESLLDRGVQPVRLRPPLALQLAALQPPDPVLAADRAAEADREVEQVVAGRVGAALLVGVLGREQERGVDVAVARVAERERDHAVALADLERLARDVAQAVERDCDVLAVGATALREDRERGSAAPPPELGDLARGLGRVHGHGVV